MVEYHRCRCVICSVERQLASDLGAPATVGRFRILVVNTPILSDFESPSAVIAFLHSLPHDTARSRESNQIIKALLDTKSCNGQALLQELLVLAFIPALHKTYREISFRFADLYREDVAQQVLTSFLELANSPALQRRNGYLSVTLARGVRKSLFRWAIKESRKLPEVQLADGFPSDHAEPTADVDLETPCILSRFLARCIKTGALTHSEYDLLVKFSLEGLQAKELANGNSGLTPTAIHHRLQRIVCRLRRRASTVHTAG
jgi:hypothetical protein